jgi:hypothetical protein
VLEPEHTWFIWAGSAWGVQHGYIPDNAWVLAMA